MRLEIKQLQRRLGVTSLYVTHDQVEAMTLADRMVVMNGGRADQIGAPLEVYANPATEFVAGFIGSPPTNFLKAELVGATMPGAATVGVRPEHIQFSDTDATIHGKVLYTEALGAETLVHMELPGGGIATVRLALAQDVPQEGVSVGLVWSEKDQMHFDSDGRRL
jgi:sn-glycerol 3-phosphate transport system ATP-binding protein